jgi:hypothetical protein
MQERKNRPGTGDKDDEQGFENVTVPPVGDISVKLAEAIKQAHGEPEPCPSGCYCGPCMRDDCGNCTASPFPQRSPSGG